MTDLIIFGVSASLIFGLLFFRFRYMQSLTGVGAGGNVDVSYWGNYSSSPKQSTQISLPKTTGLCARCGSKMVGHFGNCLEH
jgi:hypothetical protein